MMRLDLRLVSLLTAAVGLACLAGLYLCASEAALHFSFDPNEGWNAYFQAAAVNGGDLYPGPQSFMINNYPPISFYLIGTLGELIGDNIFAGRVVSLLSFIVIAVLIFVGARELGARRAAAIPGALFFAAMLLVFSDYVGMNDPQLMAQALQMATLCVILRAPHQRAGIALAAVLMTTSLFIKHNLIALPFASLAWLALYERRSAYLMAGIAAATGLVGLAVFHFSFGGNLLAHFASPRTYALANIVAGRGDVLRSLIAPVIGAVTVALLATRDRGVVFSAIYAAIGLLIGLIAASGSGVDVNAFFDLAIAVSLAGSLLIEQLIRRAIPASAVLVTLYFAPVAIGLWPRADATWLTARYWLHPLQEDAAGAEDDIAFLKRHKGAAVCETLPLCYWAGKAATVDIFNLGQAYAVGARNDQSLISLLRQRRFSVLEFESFSPFQLGPGVLAEVRRDYAVARTSDSGTFLTPLR